MIIRGFTEEDFDQIANFFDRAVSLAVTIKGKTGTKLADFKAELSTDPYTKYPELLQLANEVKQFAQQFPTIGY